MRLVPAIIIISIKHLTHTTNRDIHNSVGPFIPHIPPVQFPLLHGPAHRLRRRRVRVYFLRAPRSATTLAIDDSDVGGFVDEILDAAHGQREIARVVRGQGDVDVHDCHYEVGRDREGPPPVRVVVDS